VKGTAVESLVWTPYENRLMEVLMEIW